MFGDYIQWVTAYPEAPRAIPLIQNWVEDRIRDLDPSKQDPLSTPFTSDALILLLMAHIFHGDTFPPISGTIWRCIKAIQT